MRTVLAIAVVYFALFAGAVPAAAHHSFAAEYDENRPITLSGTVTGMQWVNPHARLFLDVTGGDGAVKNWMVEFGAVDALIRRGWNKTDLIVGAAVTVRGYLSRDGTHVAGRNVTLSNGSKLSARNAAEPAFRVHTAVYIPSHPLEEAFHLRFAAGQRGRAATPTRAAPAVMARVNGEPVERWEVDAAVREFDTGSGHRLPGEWRDEVVRSLLEEMIEQHLLAQLAQARRLEVAEADVQEGMQQMRDAYPSPEAFKKALPDMTPERLRQRTRRTLLAARLLKAEIDPKISVSEREAKAYYDQNLPRLAEGNRKPPPFAALRQTIVDYLANQQREQKTDAFLKELKARSKIEIF